MVEDKVSKREGQKRRGFRGDEAQEMSDKSPWEGRLIETRNVEPVTNTVAAG